MTDRNCFHFKYVDFRSHHVGSTGTPSRVTNIKHGKVSDIASGDKYTNIIQHEMSGFKATMFLIENFNIPPKNKMKYRTPIVNMKDKHTPQNDGTDEAWYKP
jgi:hypothetical protein